MKYRHIKILGINFTLWGKIAGYSNMVSISFVPFFTTLYIYWKKWEINICNGFFGKLGPYSIVGWIDLRNFKRPKGLFSLSVYNYNKILKEVNPGIKL